ncbi:MAG: AAA family ATPase [Microcoleaceae cyanobacterium]
MMLVAGFSGIGKTAVVNEIHKPIVKQRGNFIKGKFDQFNRNIPFSAFVQAFRDLMGQLLGEADEDLANWKNQILNAVGENGQAIIDVIPELEEIIGQQPPIPELSGSAAQNRFNLIFGKFVRVFTTKEHPLVIFLDDLQWADLASLNLLKLLMDDSETGYLLILGAYRDNEVFLAHPLMLTLDEMEKQGANINTLTLTPLDETDITNLVADSLLCSVDIATPLSQLVYQNTKGNPFFTTQFLLGLYEDGWITFEPDGGYWQCNLTQVRQLVLTDDVVEFMVGRLRKLPQITQDVLKLAACIGNKFDLATLAMVCESTQEEVATNLWRGLSEGFVIPQSESYKFFQGDEGDENGVESITVAYRFLHDRVQQAAYCLIPDDRKETTHYHIGQLLLKQILPEAREDRIFELVGQLNYGTGLITEQTERDELAQLNLIACRKARAATAYQAGREYANTGLLLLGENVWQRQYEMSLALHETSADIASLCGDFEAMEQFIETVIKQAHSLLEKLNVYLIRIQSNVSRNKSNEAIAIAQQLLQQFGVNFPETPTQKDIQDSIAEMIKLIGNREIQDLVNLPIMTDRDKIAIIEIASSIIPATYISGSPLFPLLVVLSVKLSIEYGNTTASVLAYSTYGIVACNLLQDVDIGVKFGQLALQVVSQLDAKAVKPEVLAVATIFILHRKSHIKEMLPLSQEGYATGLEVGSLEFVGYCAHSFCLNSFWCGQPLSTLEQETRAYCHALVQLNQLITGNWCRIYWQATLNLLGVAEHPITLSGEALQEAEFIPQLQEANDSNGLYYFYIYKLMLSYLFGEIEAAQNSAVECRRYLMGGTGTVVVPAFYFYDSLSVLAQLNPQSEDISEALERIEQNQTQLQENWANHAPMNHQHKVDLVEAEKCRILGNKAEAVKLYDKAILGAKTNEYIQEEALANELAAKFYLDWDQQRMAGTYMQQSYYCYARWGSKAKTNQLEEQYPQLLNPIRQKSQPQLDPGYSQTINTVSTTTAYLDLASTIKASQAISSEIELEPLLSKLMHIILENAGADKATLILNNSGSWEVVAQCDRRNFHLSSTTIEETKSIPRTIINTVKRTQQTVLINQPTKETSFAKDPYLILKRPQSLLCTPILNQGKFIGILYLENNFTAQVFTADRIEVLNLLTAQAAISIENARLYQGLEDYNRNLEVKVEQRTQQLQEKNQHLQQTLLQLEQTHTQLIQTEKMSALGQMVAGIAHEINNPITFISGNITHAREYIQDLLELLNLYQQNLPHPSSDIRDKLEEVELEFLCDDLEKLLNSMQTGSNRISQIVLSLRNFSRLDEAQMKRVNIHEGLENTLLILQHRLRANSSNSEIAIIKNYGKLPLVNCCASLLNQVFLHILSNAIDILTTSETGNSRQISISTEMRSEQTARISIADNGLGMSQSIRQRIFDPFFTTKPIGQGTGLGLSISYQIITEQHGGKLQCISQPGKGTEFIIDIPI